MSDSKSIAIASTIPAWRRAPRVEKTRFSNALHGERDETMEHDGRMRVKALRTALSHNETATPSHDWIEERLVPAFVTQVLAQVMTGPAPSGASAFAAYRNSSAQIARACDRRF